MDDVVKCLLCTAAALCIWAATPVDVAAQNGAIAAPGSTELDDRIERFEAAEDGNTRWLALQRISELNTANAYAFLRKVVEDGARPGDARMQAIALLPHLVPAERGWVRACFIRLLDDGEPRIVHEVACRLAAETPTGESLNALAKHWPVDRPPGWASMAALRLIRHMDTPAVREGFQQRIESPRMQYYFPHGEPLVDLGDWQQIPPEYQTRLLGFIKRRPVDGRRLVHAAAMSAARAGNSDAIDFLCDRLVSTSGMTGFLHGYYEVQLFCALLKRDSSLNPAKEVAKRACEAADAPATEPVWANQGRLFVLFPRGHPAADGQYRITVVDAKSFEVVKTIAQGGEPLRLERAPQGQGLPRGRNRGGAEETFAYQAHLEKICNAFPAGEHIPPERFANHPDLLTLARLVERDIEPLLAEGRFGESLIVINPQSWEQFRSTQQALLHVPEDAPAVSHEPIRADYEKYLADWKQQDDRRRALEHGRRIIWMVVKEVASNDRRVLVELLSHKDVSIRWATTRFLLPNPSMKNAKVVVALRSLACEKPPAVPNGSAMSLEQMRRHELPGLAARVLANWQVVEDAKACPDSASTDDTPTLDRQSAIRNLVDERFTSISRTIKAGNDNTVSLKVSSVQIDKDDSVQVAYQFNGRPAALVLRPAASTVYKGTVLMPVLIDERRNPKVPYEVDDGQHTLRVSAGPSTVSAFCHLVTFGTGSGLPFAAYSAVLPACR